MPCDVVIALHTRRQLWQKKFFIFCRLVNFLQIWLMIEFKTRTYFIFFFTAHPSTMLLIEQRCFLCFQLVTLSSSMLVSNWLSMSCLLTMCLTACLGVYCKVFLRDYSLFWKEYQFRFFLDVNPVFVQSTHFKVQDTLFKNTVW